MKSNDQSVNRIGRESIRAKLAAQICNGESVIRQNMPYPICMFNYIHTICLAPVVQTLDSAIHRINHYPADKYYGNQLRYPLDSDLSGG